MNKKFFTLLASAALLFSTAFTASAAVEGNPVPSLKIGANAGLYHLSNQNGRVLYIDADNNLKLDPVANFIGTTSILRSLWCAEVEVPSAALYPKFNFTNKGAQTFLEVSIDAYHATGATIIPAVVGTGDVLDWKFVASVNPLGDKAYLASYITTDTMAVLTNQGGNVYVEIVPAPTSGNAPATTYNLTYYTLTEANAITLTANDFNTVLGTKTAAAQKLVFNPDRNGVTQKNPFTDYSLKAFQSPTANYLSFTDGAKATDTLRVDTSYVNAQGVNFLGFAFGKRIPGMEKQSEFMLTYYPSNDSLTIQVAESRYKTATGWNSLQVNEFVSIQDLVKADQIRIVTVNQEQNTHISFGIGGCSDVTDTRTTIASDLYYIKNADGKYLAAPIYTDSSTTNLAKAIWVTLEANMDASRLPAYQWLVEKTRTNDPNSTSPVTITNREYKDVVVANAYQIRTKNGGTIASIGSALALSNFTPVAPAIKADEKLGYKAIAQDTAIVNTYNFNYLHQFNDAKYLNVTNDKKDTLIYVADAKTSFQLIPQSGFVKYGKTSTVISGLDTLERVSYKLVIKDTYKFNQVGKYVAIDSINDRFTLITDAAKASVFFLKEQNYKNGKPYYALVDTTTKKVVKYHSGFVKVAIDDNNVYAKINPITEIRTSAFALDVNEDPLYRRFDGKLGTVSESNATDAADTLEIFRVKETADVLYENAHDQEGEYGRTDLAINFLGVRNKTLLQNDGIKRNYSLLVDTAYVNRGTGKIKPQYLVSLRPAVVSDTTECDACGKDKTVPGYQRRWFLINTTQFAKDAAKVADYQWNTKWDRLAFVEGVRKGDSLFIFQPGYSPADRIDLATLKTLAAAGSTKVRFYNLGNNLHKDVVWQFRLINDVATAPTKPFLIESENEYRIGAATTPSGTGVSTGTTVIAPLQGGWVKIQNGVPVISRGFYSDAITDAEQFNVKASHEAPVANEDLTADAVVVIGGQGTVTIKGAAGKIVSISNVLGQTVAKQVLSSDDATISAPKGIVVVAVEGEKAVKAVVK